MSSTIYDVARRRAESMSLAIDYEAARRARERQAALAGAKLADGPRDEVERNKWRRRYARKRADAGLDARCQGLDEEQLVRGLGLNDPGGWQYRRMSVALPKLGIEEPA